MFMRILKTVYQAVSKDLTEGALDELDTKCFSIYNFY